MFADILVEVVAKGTDKTFTYSIPKGMNALEGMRVLVPFGQRKLEGFIVRIHDEKPEYVVKEIYELVDDRPVLNEEMLELGKYMSGLTAKNKVYYTYIRNYPTSRSK